MSRKVAVMGAVVAALGALLILLFRPGGFWNARPRDSFDGTAEMVKRLRLVADNVNAQANEYANTERVRHLESLSPPSQLRQRLSYQATFAQELLRAGKSAEAVELLTKIQETIEQNRRVLPPEYSSEIRDTLGISYLRLGEQENCVAHHTVDSCLMPIREAGFHQVTRGSRSATGVYTEILKQRPGDLGARWLLNLACMTLGEYPDGVPPQWLIPPQVFESEDDIGRFLDIAPRLGVDVTALCGGAIVEDFDGDGHLDIMASSWGLRDQIQYFRNNGRGGFDNRTRQANLEGIVGGLNIVHADYNNDGHVDVFVLRGAWMHREGHHPNSLLRNNGDGSFCDVTEAAGVLDFMPSQTAAWGDYNGDGWLDLFVGNESEQDSNPCKLFRNNRDGTFVDVAHESGVAVVGFVKGVVWGDIDNDGLPDLYVSRLDGPNHLFKNTGADASGRWTFIDVAPQAGVTEPEVSFPTWFWDYDNDGWLDIFVSGYMGTLEDVVADYLGEKNDAPLPRLYRNNHDGTFTDVTAEARVDKVLLSMGSNFGDLDNDGWLDFYIGTGDPDLRTLVPNRMFRGTPAGVFMDITTSGGFGHLQKGHGVAFGDLDNDGDQDIYVVMGGAFSGDVYQNLLFENPGQGNHWITLILEGNRSNRAAVGARIKVTVETEDGARDVHATVSSGGSFGGSSLRQEIGLGKATAIRAIEVHWPTTGETQTFRDVAMDRVLRIREGEPQPEAVELPRLDLSREGAAAGQHHHPGH